MYIGIILLAGTVAAALLMLIGWALGRYSRAPEIARLQEREKALMVNEEQRKIDTENIVNRVIKLTNADLTTTAKTEVEKVLARSLSRVAVTEIG